MSERTSAIQWAFSTKAQADYATAVADNDLTLATLFKGPDLVERTPEIIGDEEDAGKGHEWGETQQIERYDTKLKREFDLSSMMLGWAGAYGLGAITSAQQGGTAAYLHTITPMSASKQLPVASIVEKLDSGNKDKYTGLIVSDFEISGEGKNRLKLSMNMIGDGKRTTSTLSMPALTAAKFLRMSGLQIQIGVASAEVDVSTRLKKFNFKWDNSPLADDGYYPGTGFYRGRCEYGVRKPSLSLTVMLNGGTVERDHLENNNVLKAIITATGDQISGAYYHKMILTCYRLYYTAVKVGKEDDRLVYDLECSLKYDTALSKIVQLEVTNTQTSFLV